MWRRTAATTTIATATNNKIYGCIYFNWLVCTFVCLLVAQPFDRPLCHLIWRHLTHHTICRVRHLFFTCQQNGYEREIQMLLISISIATRTHTHTWKGSTFILSHTYTQRQTDFAWHHIHPSDYTSIHPIHCINQIVGKFIFISNNFI